MNGHILVKDSCDVCDKIYADFISNFEGLSEEYVVKMKKVGTIQIIRLHVFQMLKIICCKGKQFFHIKN